MILRAASPASDSREGLAGSIEVAPRVTRRRFLRAAVGLAAAVSGSELLWPAAAFAQVRVRRNLGNLPVSHPILEAYRVAVTRLKALPEHDERSWFYQAAIHGTFDRRGWPAWNTCQHQNWWFWAWHRMYLYRFERIVQSITGQHDWAIPFWDYQSPGQRHLPDAFRVPGSPLRVDERVAEWNAGRASFSDTDVDASVGMREIDYSLACRSIEGSPHNVVHRLIGGQAGFMGWAQTAAQDPIFYVHHANIDRLWNAWLAQGGRSSPVADPSWAGQTFEFFDEKNRPVSMTACQVLRCAEQLNYSYEGEPAQVTERCATPQASRRSFTDRVLFRWQPPSGPLGRRTVLHGASLLGKRAALGRLVASKTDSAVLKLSGVTSDAEPGVIWEVYLGLGEHEKPNPKSPAFVGNLAMFGMGVRERTPKQEFMPAAFLLPADRAIARVLKSGAQEPSLTLVAAGPLVDGKPTVPAIGAEVRLGSAVLEAHEAHR